jgi:hypothetical protein
MMRSLEARPLRRGGSPKTNPDPIELSDEATEIDASYGEALRPLLPRRLADLVPPIARAA